MADVNEYVAKLRITDPLRKPVLEAAIAALDLPQGSSGLDVGCGVGLQIPLLADAVEPSGHVTGLDVRPEFLAHAERLTKAAGLTDRVSFREGDLNRLPFEDDTFDWLWSASAAGYPAHEPLRLLRELARVVKPGGKVAIMIYTSQALLPGYPVLEARLNATRAGIAPFTREMDPGCHWMRAVGWFRDAGLTQVKAQTFVGEAQAPLSEKLRAALAALIEMRWEGAGPEMGATLEAEYRRLCSPDSPDFILDRADYYGFFTGTLFQGQVTQPRGS
jgi:ubiquinone/menaquinone biosynthesis C-methylase UbiE